MMNLKRHIVGSILSIVLCVAAADRLDAQSMDVPVDVQIPLFSKIMSYDRTLPTRAADGVVFAILYQHTFKGSSLAKDDLVRALSAPGVTSLGDMPFSIELIDLAATADLGTTLDSRKITIAYIAPLRAYNLETILEATQQRNILTLTGVSDYADRGVSIAIGIDNQHPQILINLPSAKAEGAEFNAHFLNLVRVIR